METKGGGVSKYLIEDLAPLRLLLHSGGDDRSAICGWFLIIYQSQLINIIMDRLISSSSLSTAASPVRRKSLSEQHHELTEQLIRLKFEIAEQKGKHGELQLDWQKLNSEKQTLHTELVDTEE